jgi:CRISPR-associated endoribonuclease Cas6
LERPVLIDRKKKRFVFPKDISLYFSSVDNDFFRYVFNSIINVDEYVHIGQNKAVISKIELIRQDISQKEIVAAMSPITIYSTLLTPENNKKTYYYNPYEKEFSSYIRKNLIHKYIALHGDNPTNDNFLIVPKKNIRECIIKYKGFIIKGYTGMFEIEGAQELMDIAFCAGLGGKNSQGMGLIVKEEMKQK